ncbi:Putative molybdopterin binding domain-containing protein [Desulfonema limicola]|uniref:Molybdopterin molybdenumtransferase n=1 Tax=Desulfonema limicola TaxID=45656 RepID=A0A975B6Y5_9BACT|nr:molybdopterin-binding protein [Desulfonema limicola]QTA79941.1 Putative molybdopterin binding domain-containing protein [Desulfonema limicola]
MRNSISVHDAVGTVLCHDITRIVPGEYKGPAYKKGHIITEDDIPILLNLGKEHLYVLELMSDYVHEDDAAERIALAAAGPGLKLTEHSEGRVDMIAEFTGLLKINIKALTRLNSLGEIIFGTLHSGHLVSSGRAVAGTRIIPLVIEDEKIRAAEALCRDHFPLIQVKPFRSCRVGMVTTGSEIYHGRIEDKFGPVVKKKFQELGSRVIRQIMVSDDRSMTVDAICTLISEGAEMIVVTGGMSVDPDDQTPAGIRAAGGDVVIYGAPTFPGAMFMLAYIGDVPVMGLPGCVMYSRTTIFDLVVPRILAGESVTREDIARLGHGGFCAGCAECRYPICGFGKG